MNLEQSDGSRLPAWYHGEKTVCSTGPPEAAPPSAFVEECFWMGTPLRCANIQLAFFSEICGQMEAHDICRYLVALAMYSARRLPMPNTPGTRYRFAVGNEPLATTSDSPQAVGAA
jgi:hypothetical protein